MILLYHLVFPDTTPKDAWNAGKVLRLSDFKKHLRWLTQRFKIVSLADYLKDNHPTGEFVLTFDDGYRSTFDLVSPFLLENQLPATFFVTTSHLQDGALLWFVYFNALCFEGDYQKLLINGDTYLLDSEKGCYRAWRRLIDLSRDSGDAIAYSRRIAQKYPLSQPVIGKYRGLTKEQISSCGKSQILELGGHTNSHPFLDQISNQDQLAEMIKNKQLLEEISGRMVRYFAYTGGVYNDDSIAAVKKAGFEAAFAVQPKHLGNEGQYEMPRMGIFSPSLFKFKLKVFGLASVAKWLGLWGSDNG